MHGGQMNPAGGAYPNTVRVVLVRSMAAISRTLSGPMLLFIRLGETGMEMVGERRGGGMGNGIEMSKKERNEIGIQIKEQVGAKKEVLRRIKTDGAYSH